MANNDEANNLVNSKRIVIPKMDRMQLKAMCLWLSKRKWFPNMVSR